MKHTCSNCGHVEEVKSSKHTITFDGQHFQGINGELKYWTEQFPALDIPTELRKMEAWLFSNPKNVKKQYKRFITNWLMRAQDRAPRVQSAVSITPSWRQAPV